MIPQMISRIRKERVFASENGRLATSCPFFASICSDKKNEKHSNPTSIINNQRLILIPGFSQRKILLRVIRDSCFRLVENSPISQHNSSDFLVSQLLLREN